MAATYTIDRVVPTTYLNNANQAITGYLVSVTFPEFNETLEIRVPNLAEGTVKAEADKLYNQRKALANLSKAS